jgi:hypothetical protein
MIAGEIVINGVVNEMITLDSIILKNQPIAKEGTLPYRDGNKLKRWEDLKRNIGRKVPVVDEHPPVDNGRRGLVTDQDRRYGDAIIKKCARGNRLCADVILDDDAPIKKGYSIGYEFLQVDRKGEFDGTPYDSIQANLAIDHLALTDYPRDEDELQIAGDSREVPEYARETRITPDNTSNNTVININRIGYDSLEFVDVNRNRQILDLARKLRKTNDTTASDAELLERARVMIENGEILKQKQENSGNDTMIQGADVCDGGMKKEKKEEMDEDEEKEKTSGDTHIDLIKENTQLKAEISARDSTEELRAKLKAAQDENERLKKQETDRKMAELKAEVDSLIKERGFKSEEFDGKTPDFIAGVTYGVKHVSKGPETGKPAEGADATPGSDAERRWGSDSFNPGVWCAKCNAYHADKPRCR